MSATTTHLLSSGEFCKLSYDTIPVKSESANVSFYTSNSKMPNFGLWHSCRKWAICLSCCSLNNTDISYFLFLNLLNFHIAANNRAIPLLSVIVQHYTYDLITPDKIHCRIEGFLFNILYSFLDTRRKGEI
jgi:hypothetical protein